MPPDQLTEPEPPRPATVARRAPMLWVVAAMLLGYIADETWPDALSPKILTGLALAFTVGALVVAVRMPPGGFKQRKVATAWGGFFVAGTLLLAWAWHAVRAPAPPAAWATLPASEATLTLRVTRLFAPKATTDYAGGLAEITAAPPVDAELLGRSVLFRVRVQAGETPPARGTQMEVKGVLSYLPRLVPVADDPTQANAARFRDFVHAQGAWFELARGRVVRLVAPPSAWQSWLATQHEKIEALLRHGPVDWEEKYGNIYVALVLGEPSLLDDTQRQAFTVAGEIYLFAISGLHVGVLAAALLWVLRRIPKLPHFAGELFTLAVAWLYVEIAGGTPSARRTALMLTFYLLAWWFGRARSPLAAVAAAAALTLAVDPRALDNTGFELSFTVVLGLILYAPLLRAAIERRWAPWRDIPPASHAPWQKCVLWSWERVMDLLATTWTAVMCCASLMAEFFGGFSFHVLYLNFAFLPLTCAALWAGAIAVVAGLLGLPPLTWLAWLANGAGLAAVTVMGALAKAAPAWSWLYAQLQVTPAWAGSVAALAIVAAMLLAQPKNRAPRWWYYALPVAILAGFAALCVRAI